MAKIKIKIQDLFKRLDFNENVDKEKSFKNKYGIKIKNHNGNFVNINKFVIKKTNSYKTKFSNGNELISSNEHLIMTNKGCKKIKDIKDDKIILKNGGEIKKLTSSLHKKDDILYDFCLDHPHLFSSTDGLIHHNSLIISYIIKTLLERNDSGVSNAIIVVPNKQLVEQFYDDMIEYGIDEKIIGRVYQKYKQWDKPITISTWQTLMNNHDKLLIHDCIIVDECHGMKAHQLKKILKKSVANYRFGFTGTLHASILDNWNTKSYIGPVIKEFPSGFLADKGFISKCNVNILNLEYQQKKVEGTYDEVKDIVFNNPFRMSLVKNLCQKLKHNVLLLVGKVEKEGEILEEYLKSNTDKEVVFLSGRDDVDLREEWRKKMCKSKNILMIATYGIFQMGLNIPNLKYIILAAPFKSKIRVLQSIGRSLRKHEDKDTGAYIFDLHDHTNYFDKHGKIRYRYYDSEKFEINEHIFIEGDDINLKELII